MADELMEELSKLVIDDKRCISYTYVSLRFKVHVKEAIELLDQFVCRQRNNGNNLCLNYLLSGNNDNNTNDTEMKMERFLIVDESEVESSTEWFQNGVNKHIYSVCSSDNDNQIDLNFKEYEYEVKDHKDIEEVQSLTFAKNPDINLRTTRRRTAIKPTVAIKEDKEVSKKSDKQVVESKAKPKSNTKGKGKQKNKISNMFSKNKMNENEEKEEVIDNNDSEDPFKSDSEEDTKPEVIDIKETNGNDSDNEMIIESEPKVNKSKRNSKKALSDSSDEEIIVKKSKKRDNKYKRVRIISDSDSDEPKEKAIDKYVSARQVSQKPTKKLEEKQETYVDEDGYTVTKTVKKEVDVNGESESKTEVKSESLKTKNENKTVEKKSKKEEKPVEKKPKPQKIINDKKNKNQSSITSFFKPKQLST